MRLYMRIRLAAVATALFCSTSVAGGYGARRNEHSANYSSRIRNRIAWAEFPVQVFFARDSNWSAARQKVALRGLDRWVAATVKVVRYQLTTESADAQMTVRFDPTSNDGYTTTNFTDGRITSASVRVGVKRGATSDMEAVAAHEFGHSLGIDGHSDVKTDLMYPVHRMGTAYRITGRDLNTLATIFGPVSDKIADDGV